MILDSYASNENVSVHHYIHHHDLISNKLAFKQCLVTPETSLEGNLLELAL